KVLVMDWLEGTKLDTVKGPSELAALGFDPPGLGRSMLKLQISMSYEHGFVHGDTHPGNIILLPDGKIGLIDFGLHARVPRALRDKMLEVIFYQASGRIDEAVSAFVAMLDPAPDVDREALAKDLQSVLGVHANEATTLKDNRITEQLVSGLRVGAKHHVKAQS